MKSDFRDPAAVDVICELGLEGYGLYCIIRDICRDHNGKYPLKNKVVIATMYEVPMQDIERLFTDFDLFRQDETHFWAKSDEE